MVQVEGIEAAYTILIPVVALTPAVVYNVNESNVRLKLMSFSHDHSAETGGHSLPCLPPGVWMLAT